MAAALYWSYSLKSIISAMFICWVAQAAGITSFFPVHPLPHLLFEAPLPSGYSLLEGCACRVCCSRAASSLCFLVSASACAGVLLAASPHAGLALAAPASHRSGFAAAPRLREELERLRWWRVLVCWCRFFYLWIIIIMIKSHYPCGRMVGYWSSGESTLSNYSR